MTNTIIALDSDQRCAHVKAVLAGYPHVNPEETAFLIRWFRREASAYDVAMIASDPLLDKQYQRFKADHLDKIRAADLARAFLFVSIVIFAVLSVVWMAL